MLIQIKKKKLLVNKHTGMQPHQSLGNADHNPEGSLFS